jgi:hypothetical protein
VADEKYNVKFWYQSMKGDEKRGDDPSLWFFRQFRLMGEGLRFSFYVGIVYLVG